MGFKLADNNGKLRAVWKKPCLSVDVLFTDMNEKCGKHIQWDCSQSQGTEIHNLQENLCNRRSTYETIKPTS